MKGGVMAGDLVIVIPAAGASSRMRGQDKLLQPVGGEALLARQVGIALGTGRRVLVTLPAEDNARRAVVQPFACDFLSIVRVEDASEGIAASIRAGAMWAQERQASGVMIMLADMPEIEGRDLEQMIMAFEAAPERVLRACAEDGMAGHPVIFPKRLFAALEGITGDVGARDVLKKEEVTAQRLPGRRAVTDLDTPEEWAIWRQENGQML
jgi:CTP:molybdopterin cytidylyltransferase MocA